MKVAILGAGLIGLERIASIMYLNKIGHDVEIACVVDPNSVVRDRVEAEYGLTVVDNIESALTIDPNWIFICTPHDVASELAITALRKGVNVLIEKPMGRSLSECKNIIAAKSYDTKLNVGFNYRFYPGIKAAVIDAKNNVFGKLISVKITLGHGNSPGMENSWKLNLERSGGGCLVDPGVHILDLILLLAKGEISINAVHAWTGFWNLGIEEEAHVLMNDQDGTIFNIDVSLNRWCSTFRMEINGSDGYGIVEGRGRSYGPQSYRRGRRWGWKAGNSQRDTEELVVDSDSGNLSFIHETTVILGLSQSDDKFIHACNHVEGLRIMELLSSIQKKI